MPGRGSSFDETVSLDLLEAWEEFRAIVAQAGERWKQARVAAPAERQTSQPSTSQPRRFPA